MSGGPEAADPPWSEGGNGSLSEHARLCSAPGVGCFQSLTSSELTVLGGHGTL